MSGLIRIVVIDVAIFGEVSLAYRSYFNLLPKRFHAHRFILMKIRFKTQRLTRDTRISVVALCNLPSTRLFILRQQRCQKPATGFWRSYMLVRVELRHFGACGSNKRLGPTETGILT